MEFKGTGKKWNISIDNEEGILISVRHPENRDVCTVWKYGDDFLELQEAKANALLISKAPEMLEMLERVLTAKFTCEEIKQLIKEATEI